MNLSIQDVLSVMSSALPEKGCVYLSTPITGGLERLENRGNPEWVVKSNINRAIKFEEDYIKTLLGYEDTEGYSYSEYHPPIINPARTIILGFSQDQYLELWKHIIQKFARELWLMPDFHYSDGCVEEGAFAYQQNIPVYKIKSDLRHSDDNIKEFSKTDFIKRVTLGMNDMREFAGLPCVSHENCLRVLSLEN